MTTHQSKNTLAKITCPNLADYIPRVRLFDKLDQMPSRPVTWISGPAGSGKTVLLASYCKHKAIKALCFRLDLRDADLPTFFYYLREAALNLAGNELENLPLLTAEYQFNEQVFAYDFFEQLFAWLPKPAYLIFDNYQDIPEQAALHSLLAAVCRLIPEHVRLFFLSRSAAPKEFSNLFAKRRIMELTTTDLQLDLAETQAIVALHQLNLNQDAIAALHESTGGWMAGVILCLAQMEKGNTAREIVNGSVFDYFASVIFDRADEATQSFLLGSAVFPQISADFAMQICQRPDAERILNGLAKRNFFTLRLTGDPAIFEYHPLFRAFLQKRARQDWSAEQLNQHFDLAAQWALEHDWLEEAASLFMANQNYVGLVQVILQNAAQLASQGRFSTLSQWISALPSAVQTANPWLLFWQANCHLTLEPIKSRQLFEDAYLKFDAIADAQGVFWSWSGAVSTFAIAWDDFTALPLWMEQLETQLCRFNGFPDAESEQHVVRSVLYSAVLANPLLPRAKQWLERAKNIMYCNTSSEIQAQTTAYLGLYYAFTSDFAYLHEIKQRLQMLQANHRLSSFTKILTSAALLPIEWLNGHFAAAMDLAENTLALANKKGIHVFDGLILSHMIYPSFLTGNLKQAKNYIDTSLSCFRPEQQVSLAQYQNQLAWYHLLQSQPTEALLHIKSSIELTERLGCPLPNTHNQILYAHILIKLARYDEIDHLIGAVQNMGELLENDFLLYCASLLSAYLAVSTNSYPLAREQLQKSLSIARQKQLCYFPGWTPTMMAKVLTFALRENIEVAYAQSIIRQNNIPPLDSMNMPENWPWPVRIYTLGRFTITVNNAAVTVNGASKNKLLELLKVLIALGGRNIGEEKITDILWPDTDGDIALGNLNTSLHRLRKLLGNPESIKMQQRQVSLNENICWLDIWELGRLLNGDQTASESAGERILKLYQGDFLERESVGSWAIQQRLLLKKMVDNYLDNRYMSHE